MATRELALGLGAKMLGVIMSSVGRARRDEDVMCPKCHAAMEGTGPRDKSILTIVGPTPYTRARYECPACGEARYPGDGALGIEDTSRSPGVQRMAARMGAKEAFQEVATDLYELAGIALSPKDAERIAEGVGEDIERRDALERFNIRMQEPPLCETLKTIPTLYIEFDGTGVPMVPRELEGRKGKQSDGSSKTREAKLGCVFTQTAVDDEGRPVRDPGSTTFTGAIEDAAKFANRIYPEAVRRGLFHAKQVVVLGDGAEWIKNIAQTQFPMAIRIVDFYHAKEHVGELCHAVGVVPQTRDRRHPARAMVGPAGARRHRGHHRTGHRPSAPRPRRKQGRTQGNRVPQQKQGTDALRPIPGTRPVHRLGRHRGRMQKPRRKTPQAIRHAMDRPWRQQHHRPALRNPVTKPIHRLLGSARRVIPTFLTHTRRVIDFRPALATNAGAIAPPV